MASANYAVQDLCFFTETGREDWGHWVQLHFLKVRGFVILKNISYSHHEDPVEAMTFISAAVATNSSITS